MKISAIFTFLMLSNTLLAQKITQKQALDFAEKLYQVEILSEKGRDSLIVKIQKKEFENGGIGFLPNGTSTPSYDTELTNSSPNTPLSKKAFFLNTSAISETFSTKKPKNR